MNDIDKKIDEGVSSVDILNERKVILGEMENMENLCVLDIVKKKQMFLDRWREMRILVSIMVCSKNEGGKRWFKALWLMETGLRILLLL